MRVMISGLGRTGQALARLLAAAQIDLILLDHDANHLAQLADLDFPQIEGLALDRETLEAAGIQEVSAFLALSDQEELNVSCCQIAKEIYGVSQVVARTFTPGNEPFYHRLGIQTVCSSELSLKAFLATLGFCDAEWAVENMENEA